jgi:ferredoxin, 2Fe-2S
VEADQVFKSAEKQLPLADLFVKEGSLTAQERARIDTALAAMNEAAKTDDAALIRRRIEDVELVTNKLASLVMDYGLRRPRRAGGQETGRGHGGDGHRRAGERGSVMAGKNPYIAAADVALPTKTYRITYRMMDTGEEKTVEVDPERIPYGRTGLPGSLLDIALAHHVEIEHTCGGVVACSTCHSIVRQGFDSCNEASDDELDQLDEAPGLELRSRLSCQCVPNGTEDVVVEIPAWNRNAVKEAAH